jgi:hypothetical protein
MLRIEIVNVNKHKKFSIKRLKGSQNSKIVIFEIKIKNALIIHRKN